MVETMLITMIIPTTISGWWLTYPSEKYEFVSWDYYSQLNGKINNVPNHQPDMVIEPIYERNCMSILHGAGIFPDNRGSGDLFFQHFFSKTWEQTHHKFMKPWVSKEKLWDCGASKETAMFYVLIV